MHDSEAPMDVGHCADPGCYSREINYTATMRQMTTLVELSSECHQSIKVKGTFNYIKLLKKFKFLFLWHCSTIAIMLHSRRMESRIVGGMIEMETNNISGPEVIQVPTPVSAELMAIVSIPLSNATATQLFRYC